MAYTKQKWFDHIVDPETEEVIQSGSPLSANRFNHMEAGIFSAHETADTANSAAMAMQIKLAVLMGAQFGDVSGNIVIEDMTNIDDMIIKRGVYDQKGQRIYAKTKDGEEIILLGYGAAYE